MNDAHYSTSTQVTTEIDSSVSRTTTVPSSTNGSVGSNPSSIMAVKRSPSMNDAHYSTFKYSSSQLPNPAVSNSARQMSDKLSSRIAADKAAFFASKKESQQIYENIDKVGPVSKSITKNDVAQNMAHQNEKPLLQKE